jgi:hypothetical protein
MQNLSLPLADEEQIDDRTLILSCGPDRDFFSLLIDLARGAGTLYQKRVYVAPKTDRMVKMVFITREERHDALEHLAKLLASAASGSSTDRGTSEQLPLEKAV